MCSFHETGEFGGREKGDVACSPPPNDHGFLLVHHLIENTGQILTKAGVRRFKRHEAPNWYCTAFLYGNAFLYGSGGQGIRSDIKGTRGGANLLRRIVTAKAAGSVRECDGKDAAPNEPFS